MTDNHPITPPPELVGQWHRELWGDPCPVEHATAAIDFIATQAARWGADQELEACCEWVEREIGHGREWGAELRVTRRPKPPSLAEEALEALEEEDDSMPLMSLQRSDRFELIRRALERLQELEGAAP